MYPVYLSVFRSPCWMQALAREVALVDISSHSLSITYAEWISSCLVACISLRYGKDALVLDSSLVAGLYCVGIELLCRGCLCRYILLMLKGVGGVFLGNRCLLFELVEGR